MAQQQRHPSFTCAEDIAFLHFLHDVPAEPSTNPTYDIHDEEAGYSLPLGEERKLASMFAFLAHLDGDVNHIPAVCLLENPKDSSLKILLAVNRSSQTDGQGKLAMTKKGFEEIIRALQAADASDLRAEEELFSKIVEICKERIKMRLRLKKKPRDSKDRQRMTIEQALQPALDYFKENTAKLPRNSKTFLKRAKEVINLASSWNKHQTVKELGSLVEGITHLHQIDNLEEISKISISDPGRRKHLLNMVHKVSAYRESARRLYRSAIEFPLIRRMRVEVVELPGTAFKRPQLKDNYHPSLESTISRVQDLKSSQRDVAQICRFLGVKDSLELAQDRYEKQVKTTIKESKIHAEIQLLFYCRTMLQKEALSPRVLYSSKSTCWLCNAFILLDSKINTPKFYTPRCHGKLYPGWRLPVANGWGDRMSAKFSQELDRRIADSVKTLWQRKQKTNYVGGIESDLTGLTWELQVPVPEAPDPLKLSEIPGHRDNHFLEGLAAEGFKSGEAVDTELVTAPVFVGATGDQGDPVVMISPVPTPIESGRLSAEARDAASQPSASAKSVARSEGIRKERQTPSPFERKSAESQGIAGQPRASYGTISSINRNIRTSNIVPYQKTSKVLALGRLRLQFEYAGNPQPRLIPGSKAPGHLFCTMELLSAEDIALLKLEGKKLIRAESLSSREVSYGLDDAKSLYLTLDGTVVRVTMRAVSNSEIGLPSQYIKAIALGTPERGACLKS